MTQIASGYLRKQLQCWHRRPSLWLIVCSVHTAQFIRRWVTRRHKFVVSCTNMTFMYANFLLSCWVEMHLHNLQAWKSVLNRLTFYGSVLSVLVALRKELSAISQSALKHKRGMCVSGDTFKVHWPCYFYVRMEREREWWRGWAGLHSS